MNDIKIFDAKEKEKFKEQLEILKKAIGKLNNRGSRNENLTCA